MIDGVRHAVAGDRVRLRADGTIDLLGRDSVTINTGGEKVFAEEVEQALTAHPAVADAVVAGRPSERWGSEIVAVLSARAGADERPDDELRDHCRRRWPATRCPRRSAGSTGWSAPPPASPTTPGPAPSPSATTPPAELDGRRVGASVGELVGRVAPGLSVRPATRVVGRPALPTRRSTKASASGSFSHTDGRKVPGGPGLDEHAVDARAQRRRPARRGPAGSGSRRDRTETLTTVASRSAARSGAKRGSAKAAARALRATSPPQGPRRPPATRCSRPSAPSTLER